MEGQSRPAAGGNRRGLDDMMRDKIQKMRLTLNIIDLLLWLDKEPESAGICKVNSDSDSFRYAQIYQIYSTLQCHNWKKYSHLHWKHAVNSLSILFCFLRLPKNITSFLYKWDFWKYGTALTMQLIILVQLSQKHLIRCCWLNFSLILNTILSEQVSVLRGWCSSDVD